MAARRQARQRAGTRLVATFAIFVAASAIAAPAPVAGSVTSDPDRIVLRKHTRFVAERTSVARVRVPRAAWLRFSFDRSEDIDVSGKGRLAALILVEERRRFDGMTLFAGHYRTCKSPGCSSWPASPFMFMGGTLPSQRVYVPEGNYRAYVVTDGARVTADVTLHGLEGSRRLRLGQRAEGRVFSPPTAVSGSPDGPVYSAGRTYDLDGWGLGFGAFWLRGDHLVASAEGECLYKGAPPPPEEAAYTPGCVERGAMWGSESVTRGYSDEYKVASLSLVLPAPQGEWGHGYWFSGASDVKRAGAVALWLTF